MKLTERLKRVAYQMVEDAEGKVTKAHLNTMQKYVKNLYYKATPIAKKAMEEQWTKQGL